MISEGYGNLLESNSDALVNTVNTVGVMGKGIALQFRKAYPAMFQEYRRAALSGELQLGSVHVWPTGALSGPRYIVNFPTKGHWRDLSRLVDVERGLEDLVRAVREHNIRSIAIPPLGCGLGGLRWKDVEHSLVAALHDMPDVDAAVHPPPGETLSVDASLCEHSGVVDRPDFPARARRSHQVPDRLRYYGGWDLALRDRTVAVVGMRQASDACLMATRAIAGRLAEAGYVIVSGLAGDVDAAAHEAAIEAGGHTIAVLGTGLNQVYPGSNQQLQERIGRDHLVVSQFDNDSGPTRTSFAERDATVVALSDAVVAVDATEQSGTLATVRQAFGQGRPVFASNRLNGVRPWVARYRSQLHLFGGSHDVVSRVAATSAALFSAG